MILQALNDYYARAQLAPPGWELKAIPFFIVLDHAGQVVSVTSRADKENRRGSSILVPQSEIRSGKNAWAQPNFLWDHYGFVLGEPKRKPNGEIDPSDSVEKAAKQLGAFIARVESMALKYPKSIGLAAVSKFYRQGEYKKVFSRPDAAEMAKIAGANMTFRLADAVEPVIHESWLQNHISLGIGFEEDGDTSSAVQMGVCLVTGKVEEIARLHPKVYGVCSKPSPLAAANSKEAPAYSSYGKEQGFIFPVGKPAAFSYATALNHLLRRDSTQRIQIGDASTVFWSEKESEFESAIPDIFSDPPKDDPDRGVRAVEALFFAMQTGKFGGLDDNNRFHVLGLAPNAARISIRFYHCLPLHELGERIRQHFKDLEMVRGPYDPQYPSLKRLLQAVCLATSGQPYGDIDRVPPNLGGAIVDAVFAGPDVPYPSLWLNAAVGRCRAEQNVNYYRAAAIKACINRQIRRSSFTPSPPSLDKEFLPMLDPNNISPAYRLGRLFAALERIQESAAGGPGKLNSTIRDRYYGAASSTPVAVFTTLLRLKNAHLKKLSVGQSAWFEKLLGEILDTVTDFPKHLPLPDQGRFALGYYHQRQDFFTKKPDDSSPITEGISS
jgi:CRISPR-associated protein Csd1